MCNQGKVKIKKITMNNRENNKQENRAREEAMLYSRIRRDSRVRKSLINLKQAMMYNALESKTLTKFPSSKSPFKIGFI